MNAGLPPTPISMVGREAIHAALNPVDGNSLYFVARGDGTHVFSDDLDAHNNAVKEFQLKRRADYRSSPAPTATPETAPTQTEQNGTQEAKASQELAPIPAASPNTAPEALPQVPAQDPAPAPETPDPDASAPKSPQ
jgi:UPF0755 protein